MLLDDPLKASRSENQLAQRPRCHTNFLEAPLSRAFRQLGWKVGSQPWIFLLLPMVLTAVLGTGLIYQPQDEDDDLEEQKSTEVNYASILGVSNTKTLLELEILEEISKVEGGLQALTVTQDNGTQIHYREPSRSDRLPGQHPGRNCLRREDGAEPQSHAAAAPPEDR
nr:patched domain-containing protein 3-like [Odocoileus virginianus texanus]